MKKTLVLLVAAVLIAAMAMGCEGLEVELVDDSGANVCEAPSLLPFGAEPELHRLSAEDAPDPEEGTERRWIVHFAETTAAAPEAGAQPRPQMLRRQAGKELEASDLELLKRGGARLVRQFDQENAVAVTMTTQQAQALRQQPAVAKVEEDPKRYMRAAGQQIPYGMELTKSTAAWATAGAALQRGVKACVIDSGFYAPHEDLQLGTVSGHPEGWDQDACGHGTHVAGTMAALDNGSGVVGASPLGAELFVVRVFGENCNWSYASELADAVKRCVDAGARVVNMSLGGNAPSTLERDAFADAYRKGALLVAAAGNAGGTSLEYPASYPSVLSVGAVDSSRALADFSQRNAEVDLVAPGVKVLSTVPFVSRHTVTVAGQTYEGGGMLKATATAGVSGALVDGGLCSQSGSWSGKVVLCRRGSNTFAEKVLNAERGGAVAAVVFNNEAGPFSGTLGDAPPKLPAISLAGEDGQTLLAQAGQAATVVNEPQKPGSGYSAYSGTSMASPHVAGIASFIWGQEPARSNSQVRDALLSTTDDLGPAGRDDAYGHGLVRTDKALAKLRENLPADGQPVPGFMSACEGLRCEFSDASFDADGEIASRAWDFGAGRSENTAATLQHRFANAGPHLVSLEVTDDQGKAGRIALPVSAIVGEAKASAPGSDGKREVQLRWSGADGSTVMVVRNDKLIGTVKNSGAVVDTLPKTDRTVTYRICANGGASCSEKLPVAPSCE